MPSDVFKVRIRRWAGNALAVFLGFLAIAILFSSAEGVLRLKSWLTTAPGQGPVVGRLTGAIRHKGILGAEAQPNGVIRCRAARGDRVLYDVSCKTDAAGRRLTPCDCRSEEANLALFFGCSMTFGLGVEDGETLPARYCAHTPGSVSLNYGLAGYGSQQMWLQICRQGVLKEFGPRKGIIVYTFIDDHVNRLAGTPGIVSEWPFPLPWLELRDGRVEYRGTFFDRAPLQYLFLHYVDRTHLARFVENRLPRHPSSAPPSDMAVDMLAAMVRECADTAREQAPGFAFLCLIFPKFASSQWGPPLAVRLGAANVRVLDYSGLFENTQHSMDDLFFDDNSVCRWGHPKALGLDLLARQLSRDTGASAAFSARP